MKAYSDRLKEERIFQSMSRKGNCLDNSVMENFFGLLKQEIYYGVVYYSYEELKFEIERFIKYYNEKRIKEKLGWMSPVEYRLHLLAAEQKCASHTLNSPSPSFMRGRGFLMSLFIVKFYYEYITIHFY